MIKFKRSSIASISILLFLLSGCAVKSTVNTNKANGAMLADQNLALTPPMGWNSWNAFGENVNEQVVRETADAMVNSGLKNIGFSYVVIDDIWQGGRDSSTGMLYANPKKFPSGIKALADYVHSKGL